MAASSGATAMSALTPGASPTPDKTADKPLYLTSLCMTEALSDCLVNSMVLWRFSLTVVVRAAQPQCLTKQDCCQTGFKTRLLSDRVQPFGRSHRCVGLRWLNAGCLIQSSYLQGDDSSPQIDSLIQAVGRRYVLVCMNQGLHGLVSLQKQELSQMQNVEP